MTKPYAVDTRYKLKEYACWNRIKQKCLNPNNDRYRDYGGRGISICERWMDFDVFLSDLGICPNGKSLGRIDKNSGYYPENCRWMTSSEIKEGKRDLSPWGTWGRKELNTHCSKGHLYPVDLGLRKKGCPICNKEQGSAYSKQKAADLKREVINAYGGFCVCCGEYRIEFLSIDHIFNDGAEDRKKRGEGTGNEFYKRLKRNGFPKGRLQVLCYNCNCAKGYFGYCPHERDARNLFGLETNIFHVVRKRVIPKEKSSVVKMPFRKRKINEEMGKAIAETYVAGGTTMSQLAKMYGVSMGIIHRHVHKYTDLVVV